MKLTISIDGEQELILNELKDIVNQIESELNDPLCLSCSVGKHNEKDCVVGGGTSESGLESDWGLNRTHTEYNVALSIHD